tara:strand:+ start:249 stop:494 length:246 start_codon:yes stop_codon:yes gene_type:complete
MVVLLRMWQLQSVGGDGVKDDNSIEIPDYVLTSSRGYLVDYILKEMTDIELNRVVRKANGILYERLYYLKKKIEDGVEVTA